MVPVPQELKLTAASGEGMVGQLAGTTAIMLMVTTPQHGTAVPGAMITPFVPMITIPLLQSPRRRDLLQLPSGKLQEVLVPGSGGHQTLPVIQDLNGDLRLSLGNSWQIRMAMAPILLIYKGVMELAKEAELGDWESSQPTEGIRSHFTFTSKLFCYPSLHFELDIQVEETSLVPNNLIGTNWVPTETLEKYFVIKNLCENLKKKLSIAHFKVFTTDPIVGDSYSPLVIASVSALTLFFWKTLMSWMTLLSVMARLFWMTWMTVCVPRLLSSLMGFWIVKNENDQLTFILSGTLKSPLPPI
jgi:hypothetical protein